MPIVAGTRISREQTLELAAALAREGSDPQLASWSTPSHSLATSSHSQPMTARQSSRC